MAFYHFGLLVAHPENGYLTKENYIDYRTAHRSSLRNHGGLRVKKELLLEIKQAVEKETGCAFDEFDSKHRNIFIQLLYSQLLRNDRESIEEFIQFSQTILSSPEKMEELRQYQAKRYKKPLRSISIWQALNDYSPIVLRNYVYEKMPRKIAEQGEDVRFSWILNNAEKITDKFFSDFHQRFIPYYTEEELTYFINNALFNFDLNMQYFQSLNREEFENAITHFCEDFPGFVFADDLRNYKRTTGSYVLILDKYKQMYIGVTSKALKDRIQSHWQERKPLDRLIFGKVTNSILSIDSFRHLDTTRILVWPDNQFIGGRREGIRDKLERQMISKKYLQKFLLNRTAGGLHSFASSMMNGITRPLDEKS